MVGRKNGGGTYIRDVNWVSYLGAYIRGNLYTGTVLTGFASFLFRFVGTTKYFVDYLE